jgi:hypothetical protein
MPQSLKVVVEHLVDGQFTSLDAFDTQDKFLEIVSHAAGCCIVMNTPS